MAAFCCSIARFSLSPPLTQYGGVSPNSSSQPRERRRLGFSFQAVRGLEGRRSVLVSCLGNYAKTEIVTGTSWDKLILNSDTPVLVEFFTSWCGPCRMVHRVIDEIATDYSGRIRVFILDADKDPQIAENYDIKAVPVVLLFKNGEICDSVIGTMPKEFYVTAIERVLTL